MTIDEAFNVNPTIDLRAASVGIHRDRWVGIPRADATDDQARATMASNRFDVLPIIDDGPFTDYFCTETWGDFQKVSSQPITSTDTVCFDVSIREVMMEFALRNRHFFFLTDDDNAVVGLISLVNLNCRQVKVYLYNYLANLEIGLARFIGTQRSDEQLLALTLEGYFAKQFERCKDEYRSRLRHGLDVPLLENVYFNTLIEIVQRETLYQELGCTSEEFSRCERINDLRNRVAHPTRSLVSKFSDAKLIASALDAAEQILPLLADS